MPEPLTPAIFLDRDGVINRRRADHVKGWDEFEFMPHALDALAELRRLNAAVVLVTNQGVVGRGLISADQLGAIHAQMLREIESAGGHVTAIYACLHAPTEGCACRKPKPALIRQAALDLGLDLSTSIMVGDSATDIQAARAAGVTPIFLNDGGYPLDADVIGATDLAEVVMLWRSHVVSMVALPC